MHGHEKCADLSTGSRHVVAARRPRGDFAGSPGTGSSQRGNGISRPGNRVRTRTGASPRGDSSRTDGSWDVRASSAVAASSSAGSGFAYR